MFAAFFSTGCGSGLAGDFNLLKDFHLRSSVIAGLSKVVGAVLGPYELKPVKEQLKNKKWMI